MCSDNVISSKALNTVIYICSIPFLLLFVFSFIEVSNGKELFSLNGFYELFSEIRLKEIGTITIRACFVSCLSTFLSFLISYFLFRNTSKSFQIIFLVLITIPFLINEPIRVFSWQLLLSENGLLNGTLNFILRQDINLFDGSNSKNVVFVMLVSIIPFGIFINTASLNIIPKIYWIISKDIGLNPLSTFFKIALPVSKISILITSIISFFLAFSSSSEVNFLGGASKISIRNLVLSLMSSGSFSTIFLLGSILTLLIFIFYYVINLYVKTKK